MQLETVPYLIDNPEVGYVQARWIFANPDECYLTKVSEDAPAAAVFFLQTVRKSSLLNLNEVCTRL